MKISFDGDGFLAKEIFNRYELKFPMSISTYNDLIKVIDPLFIADAFGDEEGFYSITNLYFDTWDNFFHEQNLNREPFRQKLRMRTYGNVSLEDVCYLEIKKKYNGLSNKRRTSMTLLDAYSFLGLTQPKCDKGFTNSNDFVLQEIDYFKNYYQLMPKSIISYDRKALHREDDCDVRVTFDKNLRTRTTDLRLEHGNFGEMFTPEDFIMMEVKVADCIPLWFAEIIDRFGLTGMKFSKYSQCCSASALEIKNEDETEIPNTELPNNEYKEI